MSAHISQEHLGFCFYISTSNSLEFHVRVFRILKYINCFSFSILGQVTQLSPSVPKSENVPVYRAIQNSGGVCSYLSQEHTIQGLIVASTVLKL